MKKSVLFLFAAVVVTGAISLLSSCGKEVTISYNIPEHEICLGPITNSGGTVIDSFVIQQADLQAAFAAASTTYSTSRIKSMVAKGIKFKISINGSSASNLDKILGGQVYIKTLGTPGLGTQIANTSGTIAAGSTQVDLAISGEDLKNMLSSSQSLVVTTQIYNADACPYICIKLTDGTINFNLKK